MSITDPPEHLDAPPLGDEDIDHSERFSPDESGHVERMACTEWQRPVIVRSSDLHLDADKAMQALIACPGVEIYSHGQALVEVVRSPGKHPQLSTLKRSRLRDLLSCASQWGSREGENQRLIRAPADIADTLLSRPDSGAAVLDGIVAAPTMRPDGTILDVPGYDRSTRLMYEPSAEFPQIPENPTREQIQGALRDLRDPLADFPWMEPCDESATLSAILSLIARAAIPGSVPLFAIRASTPGTGKTLLADVLAIIATGHTARYTVITNHDDEMRKRIFALALEGTPLVLLDNVEGDLGSPSLAAALTGTTFMDRVLGVSATRSVPMRAVWLATGNGLGFRGDLGRRVVPIDIDAKVEHPEDRDDFKYPELRAHVREHRARLVVAGLTVMRAYHLAMRPGHGRSPVGSFESWDALVRGACIWLELPDPVQGRQRIRDQGDSEIEALRALMETWESVFGLKPVKCTAVVKAASGNDELHAALDSLVHPREVTARILGAALKRYQGRLIGGRLLRAAGKSGGTTRWCLVPARSSDRDHGIEAS